MSLLVVASADPNSEVSGPANDMIKAHMDRSHSSLSREGGVGDALETAHLLLSLSLGSNPTNPKAPRMALNARPGATIVAFVTTHVILPHPGLFEVTSNTSKVKVNALLTLVVTCGKRGINSSDTKYQVAASNLLNVLATKIGNVPPSVLVTLLVDQVTKLVMNVLVSASAPGIGESFAPSYPIPVRDSCYGILSTFSRSSQLLKGSAFEKELVNGGCTTAGLLFGCSANEEELLRPRANASLDALLRAYQRYSGVATSALAESLLPLLWNAAVRKQKGARMSAARWAAELIRPISPLDSSHICCFLSGDADITTSSAACRGIDLEDMGWVERILKKEGGESPPLPIPKFDGFIRLMFGASHQRPIFLDFNAAAKNSTLRLALACYLCSGGTEFELIKLSGALASTIKDCGVSSAPGAISVLLDESSQSLATILKKNDVCRHLFNAGEGGLTWRGIVEFATASSNALARKSLGRAAGTLVGGEEVGWEFVERCTWSLEICKEKMNFDNLHNVGNAHGGAMVAGHMLKEVFRRGVEGIFGITSEVFKLLAQGVAQSDNQIGTGCAFAIEVAVSGGVGVEVAKRLKENGALQYVFESLSKTIKRYGDGEHTDSTRVMSVVKCTGSVLFAMGADAGGDECRDRLFDLLGSDSYKKENEVALVAGEALSLYGSVKDLRGVVGEDLRRKVEEGGEYDEEWGKQCGVGQQVRGERSESAKRYSSSLQHF